MKKFPKEILKKPLTNKKAYDIIDKLTWKSGGCAECLEYRVRKAQHGILKIEQQLRNEPKKDPEIPRAQRCVWRKEELLLGV